MTTGAERDDQAVWRQLGLSDAEYERIVTLLQREPNETELGMFAVLWSEHCAYKHSRHLFSLFPMEGPDVLQSLGENAGVIDIGDGLAVTFKVESHNHPSAIEPFHGAATGVGGIMRDIISMGARPVAILNSVRLGTLDNQRVHGLFAGITAGMVDYANTTGVPVIGGEIGFDPMFAAVPLVNVMAIGVAAQEHIATASADGPGNPVMVAGARTGRDGILAAGYASADLDEDNRPENVQIGDPFQGRLLIEATLEAIASGLIVGIQDMGAAGLTSSSSEMAAKAGTGIDMDLTAVPVREHNMTPYELMLSESQERMLIVPKKGAEDQIAAVFARWGLEARVVGRVTEDGMLTVRTGQDVAAQIPATFLTTDEAPSYIPEARPPRYLEDLIGQQLPQDIRGDAGRILLELLADPNIADKSWAYRQADYSAGGQTVIAPGKADAAVISMHGSDQRLAATIDCNSLHCYVDPRKGAAASVAEAARNLVCTGARPIALTDGMNFGNPERPEIYWQLEQAVHGIAEAARQFHIPVISGNVSLYNESADGAVMPTPVIGMVGLIPQGVDPMTQDFKRPGDHVVLLKAAHDDGDDLGGSRYLRTLHTMITGPLPSLDLDHERQLQQLMLSAAEEGLLQSAHDCSEGGLAVALAESSLSGNLGFSGHLSIDTSGGATDEDRFDSLLFGEAYGRIIVSVDPQHTDALVQKAREYGVDALRIGQVTATGFSLKADYRTEQSDAAAEVFITLDLDSMSRAWRGSIPQFMQGAWD